MSVGRLMRHELSLTARERCDEGDADRCELHVRAADGGATDKERHHGGGKRAKERRHRVKVMDAASVVQLEVLE